MELDISFFFFQSIHFNSQTDKINLPHGRKLIRCHTSLLLPSIGLPDIQLLLVHVGTEQEHLRQKPFPLSHHHSSSIHFDATMDIFDLIEPAYSSDDDSTSSPTSPQDLSKRHMSSSPRRSPNFLSPKKARFRSPKSSQSNYVTENDNIRHQNEIQPFPCLKTSPLTTEGRILRARAKRNSQEEARIQLMTEQTFAREAAALERAESHIQSKIVKASRCDERAALAQEKKKSIDNQRKVALDAFEQRNTRALKRAQSAREGRRAKQSIERITQVRERRITLEAERLEALQVSLKSRIQGAAIRVEVMHKSRQERARNDERASLARARRSLQIYERRVALLSSLDHREKRACTLRDSSLRRRRERAAEDIRRARLISRKVRAARTIQRSIRWKLLEAGSSGKASSHVSAQHSSLSHNDAATLIQTFLKERIVSMRFHSACSEPRDALKTLIDILDDNREGDKPSFETLRTRMIHRSMIQAARSFLVALDLPIELNDRTLLSAFLISTHSSEVLGVENSDMDNRSMLLVKASIRLVEALQALLVSLNTECVRKVHSRAITYNEIFHIWKSDDLSKLVDSMTRSAEQSWVAYLSSCEAIVYMSELTGATDFDESNDPFMPLRLRHDASKAGSKAHIKRLRTSLNKLVGAEKGREIIKKAKAEAMGQIDKIVPAIKEEVDECYNGLMQSSIDSTISANTAHSFEGATTIVSDDDTSNTERCNESSDDGIRDTSFASTVLDNEELVHRILLCDPSDFQSLTWNGQAIAESESLDEFMTHWTKNLKAELICESGDIEKAIEGNMKKAFFLVVVDELKVGNFKPVQDMLLDLHGSMRNLVPNRTDLHSYLRDDDVIAAVSCDDIYKLLLAAGKCLAHNLEAPSRATSTLSLFETAPNQFGPTTILPFGFETKEEYIVAALTYLLSKTEICHLDVANFKLMEIAPIIHKVGHEYERTRFITRYGLNGVVSTIEKLQGLPATVAWVKHALTDTTFESEISRATTTSKRLAVLKSRAFVDCLLFTSSHLSIPEILVKDGLRIGHIRDEARYSVIGSAVGIHICNAARVGPSAFVDIPLSAPIERSRQKLSATLRSKFSNSQEFIAAVTAAALSFACNLGNCSLSTVTETSLRSCVAAVLRGEDPVLKLLDNRVRQFFRLVCKWQPSTASPIVMRTGRTLLQGEERRHSTSGCSKSLFIAYATKEANRQALSLFSDNLAIAGHLAYSVINVAVKSYGDPILDHLIVDSM